MKDRFPVTRFNAENAPISDILRINSGITAQMHWESVKKNHGMETVANGPCSGIGANFLRQSRIDLRKVPIHHEMV